LSALSTAAEQEAQVMPPMFIVLTASAFLSFSDIILF
jgi:hypothetical protein